MPKIIEGLWDCPYCKTKGIGGLTKHCPCCGHPQDEGTKFYMGERKKYLDEDLAKQYGQGADWVCPYCGSLNRVRFKYCSNCGAPKEESEKDYFNAKPEAKPEPAKPKAEKQPPKRSKLPVLAVVLAAVIALLAIFWPRSLPGRITEKSWQRTVDVEAYRTVQEDDWSVPDGGRVFDQRQEIHHYEDVLDHYETRTRQVSESVYDGEDTHTSYSDNGDGTFSEVTYSTPRYRTEYHTETYEQPIYRKEPVFETKYYYDIERWVIDRQEKSSGADDAPCWPDYTLAENERTGEMREVYRMTAEDKKGKTYSFELPLELWQKWKLNSAVTLTAVAGTVTEIDGESIK